MKSFMLSLIVFIAVVLTGCPHPQAGPVEPKIASINPITANVGDIIDILGNNFGANQGSSFVSFIGANATEYTSWKDTEIKVKVPLGTNSGKISVTVNGTKSNEADFVLKTNDTIKICSQVWMLKNLDVDHYQNGETIPEVQDSTQWANLTTGAWCYYNNDTAMGAIYGKMYNWYAINDPRGLAPAGWRIPTDAEWAILRDCLGGVTEAGGALKEANTAHWMSPNTGATNLSGFSALPGGFRNRSGSFYRIGYEGYWWSSTVNDVTSSWNWNIFYDKAYLLRNTGNKGFGFSVRCIKS